MNYQIHYLVDATNHIVKIKTRNDQLKTSDVAEVLNIACHTLEELEQDPAFFRFAADFPSLNPEERHQYRQISS